MVISIDTTKHTRDNELWMIIREWDGYDKPHKTKIFQLKENEDEFKGGRFERMLFEAKKGIKISIDNNEFVVEDAISWIAENTIGKWYVDIEYGWSTTIKCLNGTMNAEWVFYFQEESDVVAFKLGCM